MRDEKHLLRDRRVRGLWRLHKDLPGEGDTGRPQRLSFSAPGPRRPLLWVCGVRRGLSRLGLYRASAGGRVRRAHPIETESYRILHELVDLSRFGPLGRVVAGRVIHASADLDYAESLVLDEATLQRGLEALRREAPVVTDVHMLAAGITARQSLCYVSDPRARQLSEKLDITRSAAEVRRGAIWVVGNAPTALLEILELEASPALVVGLPVGFVGAAESKEKLLDSGLPAIANRGPKGGSAVAAAALNALVYYEEDRT